MGHGRWGRDFVFDPRDGRFSPIISLFPLNCEVERCGGKKYNRRSGESLQKSCAGSSDFYRKGTARGEIMQPIEGQEWLYTGYFECPFDGSEFLYPFYPSFLVLILHEKRM